MTQRVALPARPEIILGPPGTGKTTTLIGIVEEELGRGVPPDRIGYITFTKRGATEAQDRSRQKFNLTRADMPWFRTIHSLCVRWMGISTTTILDGDRLREFADVVGERITGRFSVDDGSYAGYDRGDRILFMDNLARVRGISLRAQYEEAHDDIDWNVVDRFSRTLRDFKQRRGLIDYTDMLERFVASGTGPQLEVLLVDEAQDLSILQWQVVAVLAKTVRRLVVAGDDDQGIYKWAGADVDTLVDMEGDARVLAQSWRVPTRVQAVSERIIKRVRHRREKHWRAREDEGRVTQATDISEVDWRGESVLILARNQYLLTPVMDSLRSSGVLFEHHGHPSVRQTLLDAIVAWERLRQGVAVPYEQAQRAYDWMSSGTAVLRGHKKLPRSESGETVTMDVLRKRHGLVAEPKIWHEVLDKIPAAERAYMVRCRRRGERFSIRPRVRVGTIHESKGGEADRVVLLTDMAPRTYEESMTAPDDEARVWYVGATRARNELCIVAPRTSRYFTVR